MFDNDKKKSSNFGGEHFATYVMSARDFQLQRKEHFCPQGTVKI